MATTTRKPHAFRPTADNLESRKVPATVSVFRPFGTAASVVVQNQVGGVNTGLFGTNSNFNTAGSGTLGFKNPFIRVPTNVNPNLFLNGGRLVTSANNGGLGVGLPTGLSSQTGLAFNNGLGGFGTGSFNNSSGLAFNNGLGGTPIGTLPGSSFSGGNFVNGFVPSFTGLNTTLGTFNQNNLGLSNGLGNLGLGLNNGLFGGLNNPNGLSGLNGLNNLNGLSGLNGLGALNSGLTTAVTSGLSNGLGSLGLGVNTGLSNLGLGFNNTAGLLGSGFAQNLGTGGFGTSLLNNNTLGTTFGSTLGNTFGGLNNLGLFRTF